MIEVNSLTKRYGNHTAVDRLTFSVEKGQVYGFLGPNGAGKSTTMNIITGYLAPTDGTVTIDGIDIQKDPEAAKAKVGYLPEIPPLYTDMTVEEYLLFVAELKKVPSKERRAKVDEVCEMTQIADMKQRLIRNLSKGYRQRVGMAQAILGDPEILILDEPTVGLDPKQIIEIRDLIRKLGENHTVILSSHILSEVSAVCDKILIISHGKLVACDTPDGLQGLMSGNAELELTVRGDGQAAAEAIRTIEGVSSVEIKESAADEAKLSVVTPVDTDVREQVFYLLAGEHLPILEMTLNHRSLEDIFLELTADADRKDETSGKARKHRKKGAEDPEEAAAQEPEEGAAQDPEKDVSQENGQEGQQAQQTAEETDSKEADEK